MLILGVDTSWKHGNIALLRDDQVLGSAALEGGTFSAQLVPQIARLLSENKLKKSDVDGFSVVSGPGSFTGLRVGLAAVKALAEILHKPIAATTVLEAMVLSCGGEGKLAAALDAGRGEVFVGEYELHAGSGQAKVLEERVATRPDAMSAFRGARVVCCEQAIAEVLREGGAEVVEKPRPDSVAIARIGRERIRRGVVVTPEQLDADYIRRSDAELFSAPQAMTRVRAAEIDDIRMLMAIEKESPTAAHWSEEQYRAALEPGAVPERLCLVAEEGEVLGFIVARVLAEEWEIENVVVANSAQRQGLGSRLVQEVLERVEKRGARFVFLEVRESNHAAQRLYAQSGFVAEGRRRLYYADPEEDALLFRYSFSTATPERG